MNKVFKLPVRPDTSRKLESTPAPVGATPTAGGPVSAKDYAAEVAKRYSHPHLLESGPRPRNIDSAHHVSIPVPASPSLPRPISPLANPQPPVSAEYASQYMGLSDFAALLYRRKLTLALAALAGLLLGLAYSRMQVRTYRAEVFLEIQPPNEDFLNLRGINPTSNPSIVSEDSYIQTQAEILQQSQLMKAALAQMAHPEPPPGPGLTQKVRGLLHLSNSPAPQTAGVAFENGTADQPNSADPNIDDARADAALKRLTVEIRKKSRVIRLAFESTSPQSAADMVNSLAQVYIQQSRDSRFAGARQIQEWLQPQLNEHKADLDAAENALASYVSMAGIGLTPGHENLEEERLRLLQSELAKAESERIAKESAYRQDATDAKGASGISGINGINGINVDNEVIRQYELKLTELKRELADRDVIYTPENPKIVSLKAQIAEVETALAQQTSKLRGRLGSEYAAASQRERALSAANERQTELATQSSTKLVHYETLRQRVETARQVYDAMLRQVAQARMAMAVRPANGKVLSVAQPPTLPFKPDVAANCALGTALFGLLGICIVAMQERNTGQLRMPGQSESILSLPELGAIPAAMPSGGPLRWIGLSRSTTQMANTTPAQPASDIARVSYEQESSNISESFRAALFSILSKRLPNGNPLRTLVITSPMPGDGKTTVSSNLAIALAQSGKRVVVADCDLRRPRLHDIFRVSNHRGVCDFIADSQPPFGHPMELVQATSIPNLSVMPAGQAAKETAHFGSSSGRLQEMIAALREQFDFVLLDSAAALPFADARILASHTDGVILVLRANSTDQHTALATARRFDMDGTPVLGTILNQWQATQIDY